MVGCASNPGQVVIEDTSNNIWPYGDADSAIAALVHRYDGKGIEYRQDALQALRSGGKQSISALIAHVDDQTPSYKSQAKGSHYSVGLLCRRILARLIDPSPALYKIRESADGEYLSYPHYYYSYLSDGENTKQRLMDWWSSSQDLSLTEIQLASLDWRIEREIEAGFIDEDQHRRIMSRLESERKWLVERNEQP